MGDLIFIDVIKRQRAATIQTAWDDYVAAQARARETGNIEDGIAAGKAWAAWLRLFTGGRS